MKILKLLEGLHKELKTFNNNEKRVPMLEKKVTRDHRPSEDVFNPRNFFTLADEAKGREWISKRLKERNIRFDKIPKVEGYGKFYGEEVMLNLMNKFLAGDYMSSTYPYRHFVAAAFGYGSFDELLKAYQREKTGGKTVCGNAERKAV
jgi:hypothetical protein